MTIQISHAVKSLVWPEAEQSFGGIYKVLSFSVLCLSLVVFFSHQHRGCELKKILK